MDHDDNSAGFADYLTDTLIFIACVATAIAIAYIIVPLFNPAWARL